MLNNDMLEERLKVVWNVSISGKPPEKSYTTSGSVGLLSNAVTVAHLTLGIPD